MDVIIVLFVLAAFHVAKHRIKPRLYLDDTYNYAFASTCVWTDKTVEQLLFDVASRSNTAVIPPFYPSIYKIAVAGWGWSPLVIQSCFDWLAQTVLFLLVWSELSFVPALCAVLLFNVSTVAFRDTLYFTDRLWATTMFWINIWSLCHLLTTFETSFLVIAVVSYMALILSHKHSLQVLLIAYLALSFYYLSLFPLVLVSVGEIVAAILTRGYSWKVHAAHLSLVRFGVRNTAPANGGGYGKDQLLFQRKHASSGKEESSGLRQWVGDLLRNWDYVIYTGLATWLGLELYLGRIAMNPMSLIFLVIVVTAILTRTVRRLKCIGEGDRYLQYASLPAVLSIWPLVHSSNNVGLLSMGIIVALWVLVALILNVRFLRHASENVQKSLDPDFVKLTDAIRVGDRDRFIVFPIQKTYAFAWLTGKKILHLLGAGGFWQAKDWFPQITRSIPSFCDEYDIHHIAIDERYVKPEELDLGDVHEVYRQNNWVILGTERRPEGSG